MYIRCDFCYVKLAQSLFGPDSSGSDRRLKISFVFVRSGGDRKGNQLWVAYLLLFFLVEEMKNEMREEYKLAFLQYMDFTDPIKNVNKILHGVFLRWSTSDDIGRSKPRAEGAFEVPGTGERFWVESFRPIEGRISATRASDPIAPCTRPMHWSQRCFYVNSFSPYSWGLHLGLPYARFILY